VTRSIATVCLSGTLPDKLEAAAAAGFDAVEIFEQDLLTFDGSAREAGALCRDLGLAVALYQPFRDFEAMPGPARTRNLDRAERKFDTMGELGAPLVLVCSNTQEAALDDPQRAAATRRLPGAGMSTAGARPGRSCGARTTRPSA
jgi:4-hydroxyphenylpyruvate dioxygenase